MKPIARISVSIDGRNGKYRGGPASDTGWIREKLTLRYANGWEMVPATFTIEAGGDSKGAVCYIAIPEREDFIVTESVDVIGVRHLEIRPTGHSSFTSEEEYRAFKREVKGIEKKVKSGEMTEEDVIHG